MTTGLYYYRARWYAPELGRFLQTDPIGYEDQMNLYAYVGNDPLNATDPSGQCENDPQCKGKFSTPEQSNPASPIQSPAGLQDHFNFGQGSTYTADPEAFGMGSSLDIGESIQNAIKNTSSATFAAYISAIENEGPVEFSGTINFNQGNAFADPSKVSARNIGRFQGEFNGTMSVNDSGEYTVTGQMSFSDGDFSWAPDAQGNALANSLIRVISSGDRMTTLGILNSQGLSVSGYPGTPRIGASGTIHVQRGIGVPVPMDFNKTYSFTAWGTK